ncbi:hypothetical protein [Arthrobacter sp. PAMC 25486]|uniref:hypothetical protein n=1 Tax=Arthrobacter sp. PAMC 25486 TaxID=1494608 RepID=UPI000572064B|nr:hypothetical protein [Arthrobacter sp. PAMC 25486]
MVARIYDLSSSWTFPNTQQEVWDVIADADMSWPDWWPGCTFAKPLVRAPYASDASDAEILTATTAGLNFKATLGYTLKVSYRPTHVDSPNEITFDAGGDLHGDGRVMLRPLPHGGTQMKIEWRVRPTSLWMAFLSPVAAPAFTYAHRVLMRRGEEGLRQHLARQDKGNRK